MASLAPIVGGRSSGLSSREGPLSSVQHASAEVHRIHALFGSGCNPVSGRLRLRRGRGASCDRCQGGGTVLSEDVAAIEVTVLIEMIMDRGVDGGKLLKCLDTPELRHRPLSSSEGLV